MNKIIKKCADDLSLEILNYQGYVRGGWHNGDEGKNPSGMWVFEVQAKYENLDEEPATICAENVELACEEMKEWAKYLFD